MPIHKIIRGGEEYLPFALSQERKLRALGIPYISKAYEIGDVSISVKLEGEHSHIRIEKEEQGGYGCVPHSDVRPNGVTMKGAPPAPVPADAVLTLLKGGKLKVKNNKRVEAGDFDWIGGSKDSPTIISLKLNCDRYGFAMQVSPTDSYYIKGKKTKIPGAQIIGIGVFADGKAKKLVYANRVSMNTVQIRATGIGSTSPGAVVGTITTPGNSEFSTPWIFSRDGTKVAGVHVERKDVTISTGGGPTVFRGGLHRGPVIGVGSSDSTGNITFTLNRDNAAADTFTFVNTNTGGVGLPSEYESKDYIQYYDVNNNPVIMTIHYGLGPFSSNQTTGTTFKTLIGNDFDENGAMVPITAEYSDLYTSAASGSAHYSRVSYNSGQPGTDWTQGDLNNIGRWTRVSDTAQTRTVTVGTTVHTAAISKKTTYSLDLLPTFDVNEFGLPIYVGSGSRSTAKDTNVFPMLVALDGRDKQLSVIEVKNSRSIDVSDGVANPQWVYTDTTIVLVMQGGLAPSTILLASTPGAVTDFPFDVAATSFAGFLNGTLVFPILAFNALALVHSKHYKTRRPGKESVFSFDSSIVSPVGFENPPDVPSKTIIRNPPDVFGMGGTAPSTEFDLNSEKNFAINPITVF